MESLRRGIKQHSRSGGPGKGFWGITLGDFLGTHFHGFGTTAVLRYHREEKVREGVLSSSRWTHSHGTPGAHLWGLEEHSLNIDSLS